MASDIMPPNIFVAILLEGPCDGKLISSNEFGLIPVIVSEPCLWKKNYMHTYKLCLQSWASFLGGHCKRPHYHYEGLKEVKC